MIENEPDYRNILAVVVSRVFHPYLICIPTLIVVLSDLPPDQILGWATLVLSFVLLPGMSLAFYMQRRGHQLYERQTRNPLYLIGWLSILACLIVVTLLNAPPVLMACLAALAVWAPVQYLVNAHITKISTHAAVAAGCYSGLLMLGKLQNPLWFWLLLGFMVLTVWARVRTKNHTVPQVVLGLFVGSVPVLIVFPVLLR